MMTEFDPTFADTAEIPMTDPELTMVVDRTVQGIIQDIRERQIALNDILRQSLLGRQLYIQRARIQKVFWNHDGEDKLLDPHDLREPNYLENTTLTVLDVISETEKSSEGANVKIIGLTDTKRNKGLRVLLWYRECDYQVVKEVGETEVTQN